MKVTRNGVELEVRAKDLTEDERRVYNADKKARQRERDKAIKESGADPKDVRAIAARAKELRTLEEKRLEEERIKRMSQEVAASVAKTGLAEEAWDSSVALSEAKAREVLASRGIVANVQDQIVASLGWMTAKRLGLIANYFFWAYGPLLQIFERRCMALRTSDEVLIKSAENEASEAVIHNTLLSGNSIIREAGDPGWQVPKTVVADLKEHGHSIWDYTRLLMWRDHWLGVYGAMQSHQQPTPSFDELTAEVEGLRAQFGPVKVADVSDAATGGARYKSEVLSHDELFVLWEFTAMATPILATPNRPAPDPEPKKPVLSASSILGPDPIKRDAGGNEIPAKTDKQLDAENHEAAIVNEVRTITTEDSVARFTRELKERLANVSGIPVSWR